MIEAIRNIITALDPGTLTLFLWAALALALGMLVWDCVEVGRNDAANLINAVYGARIISRRAALWVAGFGVVLGAWMSSGVIDTARKGIFSPGMLQALDNPLQTALSIYISVYIVDTVLLYGYSAFGMPVSTTACLVFELLGASFAVGGPEIVKWPNAGKVVFAIICSIIVSGVAGFVVQRALRGALGTRSNRLHILLLHGGWAGGGILAMLTYFMVVKGMHQISAVRAFQAEFIDQYGAAPAICVLWAGYGIAVHFLLVFFRQRAARMLFPVLAVLGTACMGFAFGQNDLANCASPGLSAYTLIENREAGVKLASQVELRGWMLLGCGLLLTCGMATQNAQRVTRAAASAGSMSHTVALYAPRWCMRTARWMLRGRERAESLAPPPVREETGEVRDYDSLRACVILGVSASVIATASSFDLPVSTTYVAFAAVVTTGAADRILQRGDADVKLARTIWVIFSWFACAIIAAVAAGVVCRIVAWTGLAGMLLGIGVNLIVRFRLKKVSAEQEKRVELEARERAFPEEFAEYDD